jgi:predicted acyltransferase
LKNQNRVQEVDVLRGLAIFGMILSGSIAFGDVLPAWMYHAQVPPPLHQFNPLQPGITWVDLVFPFFLFCLGIAIPLAVTVQLQKGFTTWQLVLGAGRRYLQLLFFGLFFHHCKAWVIREVPVANDQLLSLFGYLLLFGQLMDTRSAKRPSFWKVVQGVAYLTGIIMLWVLPFKDGNGFSLYHSDIIIVVLANMAFFGTLIYIFTQNQSLVRWLVLPLLAAVIIAAREVEPSFVQAIFNFKSVAGFSFDWAYKFYFLKYLFIVIPGIWAGEQLVNRAGGPAKENHSLWLVSLHSLLVFVVLIFLLTALFARWDARIEFIGVGCLALLAWLRFQKEEKGSLEQLWTRAGTYLLLLGLCLEPYEGGIKKDPSTFSYYFITTGFGFWALYLMKELLVVKPMAGVLQFLTSVGRNPLVAYATGSLLVLPVFSLIGFSQHWNSWALHPWQGFLKGLIFTLLVSWITLICNRFKIYWRA